MSISSTVHRNLLVAVLALPFACRTQARASSVSDSTFVRTMVDLRRVQMDSTIDSTMQDSARRVVLRRNGVSVQALEDAARALASEPTHAASVWREIETRTRRPLRPPIPRSPPTSPAPTP